MVVVAVVINVVVFGLVLAWLARQARGGRTLSARVLLGVAAGVACGVLLQAAYGLGSAARTTAAVPRRGTASGCGGFITSPARGCRRDRARE